MSVQPVKGRGMEISMDTERYSLLARHAAEEGIVLLENKNQALPIKKNDHIAIFGRIQFSYYKSGTGSGGMVHSPYETNILDALRTKENINIDQEVEAEYRKWLKKHPFERTYHEEECWYTEPWAQEEMPVSDDFVRNAALKNEKAIIVIGRTAGEERDNKPEKGSYYLSLLEEELIKKVRKYFLRVIVVLNVSNIIDMAWVARYNPDAVLYVWQGGLEGGNAAANVLTGEVNPCGKLSDTIAVSLSAYPAFENYGGVKRNFYEEDIYVGYRYFETFAQDQVLYPFGFGKSYTQFEYKVIHFVRKKNNIEFEVKVQNAGTVSGKEVIQIYVQKPCGRLGNPRLVLAGFAKTGILKPGEAQMLPFCFNIYDFASYDDSGITGNKSCYILEPGEYCVYAGIHAEEMIYAGTAKVRQLTVVSQMQEVLSPVVPMKRMKAESSDRYTLVYENVPVRSYNLQERIQSNKPCRAYYAGQQGWKLPDVKEQQISMNGFLSQLSNEELACLIRGEGMRSPKVTSGTAAAFGGVTKKLQDYGIPLGCCADGPSGIRRDDGHQAYSLPSGTALACTFNTELVEQLYEMLGIEMAENNIDLLLGPGMNIHRFPLNGRNFEYFSEDPCLSGKMAAAEIRGIARSGCSGTLKHFAGNNQEFGRTECDAVVSERALREIYLKGFEIALRESSPLAVMSTYGAINGIWTAGNYDLLTTVLRNEWGYQGLVMTDWEAKMNDEGEKPDDKNTAVMVRAQNDLYMVVSDSETNSKNDNTMQGIENGKISREELVRNAKNICTVLLKLQVRKQ